MVSLLAVEGAAAEPLYSCPATLSTGQPTTADARVIGASVSQPVALGRAALISGRPSDQSTGALSEIQQDGQITHRGLVTHRYAYDASAAHPVSLACFYGAATSDGATVLLLPLRDGTKGECQSTTPARPGAGLSAMSCTGQ